MSTAPQPTVSDATDLREIAAAIRAVAKRSGGGAEVDVSLEAVAAEMEIIADRSTAEDGGGARARARQARYLGLKARQLRWMAWTGDTLRSAELLKLAKDLEDGADRLKEPVRAFAGARGLLLARQAPWLRFAPVAVAVVIGAVAVVWSSDRWLSFLGGSRSAPTETALAPPAPPQPPSASTDPALPTNVIVLPPPVLGNEPPPPVLGAAQPPSPPAPATAVLGTRLAAAVIASEKRVAKLEAPSEPKPRRVARAVAPVEAPPAVRQLDLSHDGRDDAAPPPPADAASPSPPLDVASPSPPVEAASPSPPDQPPSAPDARQAALPPATATGAPVPLVAAAPAAARGDSPEPVPTAGATAPNLTDCVPYSSDTTMTGRSEPVQGLACRDASGKWRRVSEVPRPNRAP